MSAVAASRAAYSVGMTALLPSVSGLNRAFAAPAVFELYRPISTAMNAQPARAARNAHQAKRTEVACDGHKPSAPCLRRSILCGRQHARTTVRHRFTRALPTRDRRGAFKPCGCAPGVQPGQLRQNSAQRRQRPEVQPCPDALRPGTAGGNHRRPGLHAGLSRPLPPANAHNAHKAHEAPDVAALGRVCGAGPDPPADGGLRHHGPGAGPSGVQAAERLAQVKGRILQDFSDPARCAHPWQPSGP